MLEAGLRPDGDARRFRLPFRRAQGFGGGAAVGAHQPAGAELGAAEVADDADDDMVQVLSFDGAQDRLAGGAAGLAAVAEAVLAADAVGPAQVRGVRVAGHGGAQALKGGVWRVGARGVGDENRFFDGVLVAGGGFEGGEGFHGRGRSLPGRARGLPAAGRGPGGGGWISRKCPGARPSSVHSPTRQRSRRRVGKPTAAVMRRAWRLRPSRRVSSIQLVGMAARRRIGGSRGHRPAGSSIKRAWAGRVGPSLRTTPSLSFSKSASPGTPSTCAQ